MRNTVKLTKNMKKLTVLILSIVSIGRLTAQTTEGDVIVDVYGGYPNWANVLLWSNYQGTDATVSNYQVKGSPLSYGARVEYMTAPNFGLGLDVGMETSGFEFNYNKQDTLTNQVLTYHASYTAKKTRAMIRMNFHFAQSEKVDAYFGVGAGYKYVNRSIVSNEPGYDNNDLFVKGAMLPLAFRASVGSRFFFTPNFGGMLELGLGGGGLIQFGLTGKF